MSKQKRRYITLVVVLALIVIGGASAGIWYALSNSTEKQADTNTPITAEQKAQDIVDSVANGVDATVAGEQLEQLADDTSDTKERSDYLAAASDLYVNSNNYPSALKVASTVEESNESALSAGSIAHIYELQGDYENAAKYYQIAADRSDKPLNSSERAPYNDYLLLKKAAEAKI